MCRPDAEAAGWKEIMRLQLSEEARRKAGGTRERPRTRSKIGQIIVPSAGTSVLLGGAGVTVNYGTDPSWNDTWEHPATP